MNVSLAALRARLLDLRSWDSTGDALNSRIKEALNLSLDRLAGDVPEALLPDEEHVVVYKDVKAEDATVDARIKVFNGDGNGVTGTDKIVMLFTDTAGTGLGDANSLTTWKPTFSGEWDGLMHLEITDSNDLTHRRQSREWFTYQDDSGILWYAVVIDRPWGNNTDALMKFRIYQPEFFVRDDVMELLEPARIYDGSRQQIWKMDTAGAYRQDMVDFQGNSTGRPHRMWRGRHFQLPAPTEPPQVIEASGDSVAPNAGIATTEGSIDTSAVAPDGWGGGIGGVGGTVAPPATPTTGATGGSAVVLGGLGGLSGTIAPLPATPATTSIPLPQTGPSSKTQRAKNRGGSMPRMYLPAPGGGDPDAGFPAPEGSMSPPPTTSPPATVPTVPEYKWHESNTLRSGTWGVCYTYVWGRRDLAWQQSPLVTPGGHETPDNEDKLSWCYEPTATSVVGVNRFGGIHDPTWESAPSPVTVISQGIGGALVLSATNLDAMLGFGDSTKKRYGHTGMRIRYYVTHLSNDGSHGAMNGTETNQRYYLLCEVEPTFDHVAGLTTAGITAPSGIDFASGTKGINSARVVWNGDQLYDYHRPMKHSTGYYAWSVYPHQDDYYELDFRVLRLPRKYIDDQDTAPIQRDAIPALMEMALHYISMLDGNDQLGAVQHLARYQELVRLYRQKYGNPGGIVEPVPLTGYSGRGRYGTFSSVPLED